jgi:type IV fimbrial biogenesis protein FimT
MINFCRFQFPAKKSIGFTLIELLTTLAIAGILATTAVPALSDFAARERRAAAINSLISSIRFTRSLALKTQRVATLCPSDDGQNCRRNWNLPMMIFVDVNNDRKRQLNETVYKNIAAIDPQDRLKWKAFRNSNVLQFLPTGITNHQNGTFLYCPKISREDLSRGVIMTKMGRTRLSEDSNLDGIQEGAGGRKLFCR